MEHLEWSFEENIAVITLNRPPANALSTGMLKELSFVLDEMEGNTQVYKF